MQVRILLISGAVATGKSTLVQGLHDRFGVEILKTKKIILARFPNARSERRELQGLGDELDRRTHHQWVRDELHRYINERLPEGRLVAVDAVRKTQQVDNIRQAYGPRVFHIHLKASDEELAKRYADRKRSVKLELRSYSSVKSGSETERRINDLEEIADAVIPTDRSDKADVLIRVASHL